MPVSMAIPVMVLVEKEIFIAAINCKCRRRDAQAGEAAFESIPSREWSRVSPRLSILTSQPPTMLLAF